MFSRRWREPQSKCAFRRVSEANLEAVRLAQGANKPAGTLAMFSRRWRENIASAKKQDRNNSETPPSQGRAILVLCAAFTEFSKTRRTPFPFARRCGILSVPHGVVHSRPGSYTSFSQNRNFSARPSV